MLLRYPLKTDIFLQKLCTCILHDRRLIMLGRVTKEKRETEANSHQICYELYRTEPATVYSGEAKNIEGRRGDEKGSIWAADLKTEGTRRKWL